MIFPQEYQSRLASVQALMVREGLDALIISAAPCAGLWIITCPYMRSAL